MPATYENIATTTLGSNQASVTFSSLGNYTDIFAVCYVKSTTNSNEFAVRFNSDSGTNYSQTALRGNGSSASSERESNTSGIGLGGGDSFYPQLVHIMNYNQSNTNKTVIARGEGKASGTPIVRATVGLWRNTAAITSITFVFRDSSNIQSGSEFTIYGIKAA